MSFRLRSCFLVACMIVTGVSCTAGPEGTSALKVFAPTREVDAPVPAVLLVSCGGEKTPSEVEKFRGFFQGRPVRFFLAECRPSVSLQDARCAVRTIRDHAEKWKIDPNRVLVVGVSSGGPVVTGLAARQDPVSRPDYVALFSPVIGGENPSSDMPPMFLAHAKDDPLVPAAKVIKYHEALKKAGVAVTLKIYRRAEHPVTKEPNPWKANLGSWMSDVGILPEGVARPLPGAPRRYDPTSRYTVKNVEGWKVYLHNSLLPGGEHAETGARAIGVLADSMRRLKTWVPRRQLKRLMEVPFWIEWDSTNGPWGRTSAYHYHPGIDWLIDMDYNPEKHKCVEYGRAASLSRRSPDSAVGVLLHELAHAYHDQVLTFDDPEILAAYKRSSEGTAYPKRDWVRRSNHKEFFAGLTTRYFGRKEEREAVGQRDSVLEKYLRKVWGTPRAFMDTPWESTLE